MRFRMLLLTLAAVLALSASALAATASAARPATPAPAVAISPAQSGGVLDGVLTITSFAVNEAGQLVANGVFTGTVTINGVTTAITSTVTSILQATPGSCPILDLVVGPLHLDLLGLVVDLNQVHLTITAQSGPGNLVGNLLCTVTHLLDTGAVPGLIQQLIDLINQLLGGL
jgi:hypothetical protein